MSFILSRFLSSWHDIFYSQVFFCFNFIDAHPDLDRIEGSKGDPCHEQTDEENDKPQGMPAWKTS